MLNHGYVSGLFLKEDIQGMANQLRQEAKSNGIIDTPETLVQYWYDKLQKSMHTILCFSPVGDNFRIRARKFPGIINCTMINWFHKWPRTALVDVAYTYLEIIEDQLLRKRIAKFMAEVHTSINIANKKFLKQERRHNYTTPKSFLEFKNFYNSLLKKKQRSAMN